MRGLLQLTWVEIKVFVREPLGAIGTIVVPVIAFIYLGKATAGETAAPSDAFSGLLAPGGIPTLLALTVTVSAVLSLANIISIYREGGILKRMRATPLRPWTILTSHVLVKLLLTALTMTLMLLAGKRYFSIGPEVPVVRFTLALLISVLSILSLGFILASVVPTPRFAQPIGAVIFYPMIGLSGLFVRTESLPPKLRAVAKLLPFTHSTSLLQGIWTGDSWDMHRGDLFVLAVIFAISLAITSRVFRWE
ncbi:MAG TPA: ABC transporter permease [Gemmatimonadaceae bacterium]|nr:ABC transporter permease [Gemmatimonadaceae bacterium]